MTSLQTTQRKKLFFDALRETGNISLAARTAGIERKSAYLWKEAHPDEWAEAELAATEALEAEARRRAVEGTRRLKFDSKGKPLIDPATGEPYVELDYSDTLLIFLMKARDPAKYRERYGDINVSGEKVVVLIE